MASYARQQTPAVKFSSLALFRNNLTVPHKDSHNCPQSTNQVFAISEFTGGRVVVEDPEGDQFLRHNEQDFRGRALSFKAGVLRFSAREIRHWTEPWVGDRVVLVSYTIRDVQRLSKASRDALLSAKFALPGQKAEPLRQSPPCGSSSSPSSRPSGLGVPTESSDPPASLAIPECSAPLALELFSGRGRLSQQLRRAGFSVVSLDLRLVHSLVPVCKIDLASQKGQKFVWSLLDSCHPAYVHLGLPADTVTSRSHSSQDLRSLRHPGGRPDLLENSVEGQRVAEANRLYRFAFDIAVFCIQHSIPFCLENPPRSFVWQLFASMALASEEAGLAGKWNNLEPVDLHACMFGGARAKPLRFLCPKGLFSNLAVACDKSHSHKPWLTTRSRAEVAEDASYPTELCIKMVTQLLAFLRASHLPLPAPVRLHDKSLASVGKQPRRFQPLIPEYREIVQLPQDHPLPSGAKVLSSSQLQGVSKASPVPSQPCEDVTVGLWHSPVEFFTKACSLAHPMDTIKPVAMVTKAAIDAFLHGDAVSLAKKRTDFLDYLEQKIARLKPHEETLHRAMPGYMQGVLKDKNLLAWEEILKETGYPDLDCVRFMKEGVKLIGCEEHPKDFAKKVVPATLSEAELRSTAKHRRGSLETLSRGHPSDEDASLLAQATAEEVEAGFLEKGMSAEEVSDFFGHSNWAVVRRFVLIQDGGRKVRPIDDCLEAQLNSAFTSTIALQLQDSDYISSLALFIAERLQSVKPSLRTRWLGKCLDLSKAYKQMAVHPRDRDLCVIMVHGPKGKVTYHICNSLVFGVSASVFAFV